MASGRIRRLLDSARFATTTLRTLRDGLRFADEQRVTPPAEAAFESPGKDPLECYFDAVREGPGIWKWRHYFPIYHRHLAKFVGREVHVVEVGIYSGGSLSMWHDYFGEGCRVYGVDIEPACVKHERDGVDVFIGDQGDPEFWARFVTKVPRIDVVIDDGGHLAHQQITTLRSLLPHMSFGGVYICEDVLDLASPFHSFVEGLTRPLGHVHPSAISDEHEQAVPRPVHQQIASLHRYPLLTVLERPARRIEAFDMVKRGTVWQPGIYDD